MDNNYRAKLNEGMDDLLKDLEGKAREVGDYCKKHDLYIGDAKMCPWCEIDALNEKCCPGDLKPSVVARWPMAARRAFMSFEVELTEKDKRIEELEEASVKEVLEFGVEQMSRGHDKYYIFDNEMINAAWIATRGSESGRGILRIFHIHECEGCVKGRVWISDGQDGDVEFDHAACNGHGWVIGGEDE